MGVLDAIIAQKQVEVPRLRAAKLPAPPAHRALDLRRSDGGKLHLICEIKLKSPSAGALNRELSVAERARLYERGGASMLSVLCDEKFFDGSFEHLKLARETTTIPLLAKEFIIDESQLDHASAYGASAALLIVRCLEAKRLATLIAAAKSRNLVPLVEVTNEDESKVALDAGATHVGVNARDLDTLVMDAERARRVLESLPSEIVRCHFSGVKTKEDVAKVSASGASAALIGEVLMKLADPSPLLAEFRSATGRP